MSSRQKGFINFGSMTLLIGGLALAGLLVYGAQSGHELPIWPAIAVTLVNLVAAGKMIYDVKKQRQQAPNTPPTAPASSAPAKPPRR